MKLNGKKVAILVADGFEEAELTGPREALAKAGAHADIVSPAGETVRAWDEKQWGKSYQVDVPLPATLAPGLQSLLLSVDNAQSNQIAITVQ